METIKINTSSIKLDQFLKWAGITDTGGQAAALIADKMVTVNDCPVIEKRKKIFPGDIVSVKGCGNYKVTAEEII